MPIYEYRCVDCARTYSVRMGLTEHDKGYISCPDCKEPGCPVILRFLRKDEQEELSRAAVQGNGFPHDHPAGYVDQVISDFYEKSFSSDDLPIMVVNGLTDYVIGLDKPFLRYTALKIVWH